MLKLIVLVALVVAAYGAYWEGEMPDVPGISAESMDKLRQMMTPRPATKEQFKQVMQQWLSGLSDAEKAAADTFWKQMRQKFKPQPE